MAIGIQRSESGWQLDATIAGIAIDSRLVKPGYIFVAIPGSTSDGHRFISDAISRGAVAVVGERPDIPFQVPYIRVDFSRQVAAELSAILYGHPSRELTTVGVTGTNGKTSVVYWLTALIRGAQSRCGMISSVVNDNGCGQKESVLTTPESPDLQGQLREMVDNGMSHAVIEVSSHGIAQHRVDQLYLDLAVLTNITREHLDFHGTMENYVATKSLLFERLDRTSLGAVLNADDIYSQQVKARLTCPVITFGLESGDVRAKILSSTPWASEVRLIHQEFDFSAELKHPGIYNVYNLAAAVAAAYRLGIEPAIIQTLVSDLPEVPGRMQVLAQPGRPTVIIDYAHTPDGLHQSLKTVRNMVPGDVWLVFGARGGRDRGKRPEMGRIAATFADHIILTTDSPNDEEPLDIAYAIEQGIREVNLEKLEAIEIQRDLAIQRAIRLAGVNDCVVVTGRGPEAFQYFKNRRVRLKDVEVAMNALDTVNRREGVDGVGIH